MVVYWRKYPSLGLNGLNMTLTSIKWAGCTRQQTVEQIQELPVIWDAMFII